MDKLKKLWKNDYFQTALMIALVIIIVFGFWSGMAYALGTEYPMVAVSGPSMCTLPGSYCDGWSHPFERTLHDGDLVVLQGVSPTDINVGDIIVYHRNSGDFIIHRVIGIVNGTDNKLLFRTKGDGNSGEDPWSPISQDNVIGRVILRIPWLGHIALIMHNSFAAFIIIAIIILLIFELIIPALIGEEGEKTEDVQKQNAENTSET